MLPGLEIPRETEDYEGFYHLTGMSGDVAKAELHYIVRDHDKNLFEARKETLRHILVLVSNRKLHSAFSPFFIILYLQADGQYPL